jgi:TonB family protein
MFREHGYPRQLSLFVNGSGLLRVNVSSLREGTFDQTAFIPPRDAITRRQCEHMKPPKPTKTPDPAYPQSAAQNGLGGTAIVAPTVLPDGSVENVQLIRSATREMDRATQETVKTWKFKPATCGSESIALDITVEVIRTR